MFGEKAGVEAHDSIRLENYLRRHDLKPKFHISHKESNSPGNSLLSLATVLGVNMLVMGCYGHSRAREWVLGGATRTVLKDMTLPVLMAH
jgi:nucleotide-binding universal stress UspA family protein